GARLRSSDPPETRSWRARSVSTRPARNGWMRCGAGYDGAGYDVAASAVGVEGETRRGHRGGRHQGDGEGQRGHPARSRGGRSAPGAGRVLLVTELRDGDVVAVRVVFPCPALVVHDEPASAVVRVQDVR